MHPKVEVTVDGQPVAGAFYERLISLTVSDKEGVSSDTFTMDLNDGQPNFLALPKTGAKVDIKMGYLETGVRSIGSFVVDKVQGKCLPYGLTISGKSADLRKGKLKENQERHWDKKTLVDILGEIASESNLSPSIDPEIGQHTYEWMAQQDESNIHFVERLARRHNAIFAVKAGKLIFSKRGSGNSTSGAFLGTVVVSPPMIIQGSCTFEANDRSKYQKVVAYYQDKDQAKRIEVEADSDAEGDSVYRLPEPYADAAEADKAAQSKAKQLKRGEGACSVTVKGDTSICAGAPLLFRGVRPGLDGVPYIIDSAEQVYSKSGFTTRISGKLYDGSSSEGGKKPDSSSDSADTADGSADAGSTGGTGTVAPNSPAGTPATPDLWTQNPRRSGSTDSN